MIFPTKIQKSGTYPGCNFCSTSVIIRSKFLVFSFDHSHKPLKRYLPIRSRLWKRDEGSIHARKVTVALGAIRRWEYQHLIQKIQSLINVLESYKHVFERSCPIDSESEIHVQVDYPSSVYVSYKKLRLFLVITNRWDEKEGQNVRVRYGLPGSIWICTFF